MKLNIGCGNEKIEGFKNVDIDPSVNPDEVFDFTAKWPYEDESVESIVCYHVLEHIKKDKHDNIFSEAHRVLTPQGTLVISFPEFLSCVKNWEENKRGQRDFWEATIYGRQLTPHDYHISLMHRNSVSLQLINHGFKITYCGPEPVEDFNSVIKCVKDVKLTYEDLVLKSIGFQCQPELK